MITDKSNNDIKPRKTVKVSDPAIFWGIYTSPVWDTLINKPWDKTCLLILKYYFRFNKAMLAFLHWGVFHFKPGSQTTGILLILASLCFVLSYNSIHVPAPLKPVAGFAVPFWVYSKSWDELYRLAVIDVESKFLLVYTGLFVISALVHLVTIWIKGNPSITKRGNSWIGYGLSKFMRVDDFVICGIVEPLISIGIGIAAWKLAGDVHFGVFMILAALSEAAQQILDKSYQAHTQSILNA